MYDIMCYVMFYVMCSVMYDIMCYVMFHVMYDVAMKKRWTSLRRRATSHSSRYYVLYYSMHYVMHYSMYYVMYYVMCYVMMEVADFFKEACNISQFEVRQICHETVMYYVMYYDPNCKTIMLNYYYVLSRTPRVTPRVVAQV
jgi:DNA-binding ferritin-like protein (Dps family)